MQRFVNGVLVVMIGVVAVLHVESYLRRPREGRDRPRYLWTQNDDKSHFSVRVWRGVLSVHKHKVSVSSATSDSSFSLVGFKYTVTGGQYVMRATEVPLWIVYIVLGAYPVVALVRGPLRRRRWQRQGRCVVCGYDLLGNVSGACSECGAQICGVGLLQRMC